MNAGASQLVDTGLEVVDLQTDESFKSRRVHTHAPGVQLEGLDRIANAFLDRPESILQELVNAAIDLCGADSAGISIQIPSDQGVLYHWVATAGVYQRFADAKLPPYPSACAVCIERGRPQIFRVSKRFFDIMGIEAETVADGILIPWQVDDTHGTIWIIAHHRPEAFDASDCQLMQSLANFAAMGVRQQRQQKLLVERAAAAAAANMANLLAHSINNPLQALTNILYINSEGPSGIDTKSLAQAAAADLERLSALVKELLSLPTSVTA